MKLWKLSLLSLSLPFALSAEPSSDKTEQLHLNTFENAQVIKYFGADFPEKLARNGEEGWVILSYVVEPNGSVSNIVTVESSNKKLEKPAVKAMKKWKFQPATLQGKPIQQCKNQVKFSFSLASATVDNDFKLALQSITEMVQANDLEGAKDKLSELQEIERKSFRKQYLLNITEAQLAKASGDKAAEYSALSSARYNSESLLNNEAKINLFGQTYLAAVNVGKYAEAFDLYEELEKLENSQTMRDKLQSTHQQVVDFITSNQPYLTKVKVSERGSVSQRLTRNAFSLSGDLSDLSTLDIRCERKLSQFKIAKDVTWNIPQNWGKCHLVVHGDENTEFTIVELNQAKTEA